MKALALLVLAALGMVLLAAGAGLPRYGDPDAPAARHVSDDYVRGSMPDAHTPNVVTTMIADYRSFDTLGETLVVFAAGLACMLLLREPQRGRAPALGRPKDNVITDIVTRAMIPVIQLFALYVVFHGHYSPGGGFQGGALIATSILLARMVLGFERSQYLMPSWIGTPLGLAGLALFAGVGLVALPSGGNLLDYGHLPLGLPSDMLRNWGILFVEVGVALAVAGTLVSIFDDLMTGGRSGRTWT